MSDLKYYFGYIVVAEDCVSPVKWTESSGQIIGGKLQLGEGQVANELTEEQFYGLSLDRLVEMYPKKDETHLTQDG